MNGVGRWWQTMYIYVSKCKSDKIKLKKEMNGD
jgi:hypothetical protein